MMIAASRLVQRLDQSYANATTNDSDTTTVPFFPLSLLSLLTVLTPASYWRESLNNYLSRFELNAKIVRVSTSDKFETEVIIIINDRVNGDRVVSSAVGTSRSTAAETACHVALRKLVALQATTMPGTMLIDSSAGRLSKDKLVNGLPAPLASYLSMLPLAPSSSSSSTTSTTTVVE